MSTLLATGARRAHTRAFDELAQERLSELDLPALLVYLIDTVSADALPFLAEQFNVDGFRGYIVAATDQAKRDLISRAIELNKVTGTPYGISAGLNLLGCTNVSVQEGIAAYYNAFWTHEGVITYGSNNWASFITIFTPPDGQLLDTETEQRIRKFIEEYKNVRSYNLGLYYAVVAVLDGLEEVLKGWYGLPDGSGGIDLKPYSPDVAVISEQTDSIVVNGVTYNFNTVTISYG